MFKDIKKQIRDQTREQLDHVRVPQQPGIIYKDTGSRSTYAAGLLRYNRKLFTLQRGDGFILNKPIFDLYGGNYLFSNLNSTTDGALIDNYLPVWANVEYSTSFIANKDATVSLPYEISADSVATIYIAIGEEQLINAKYTITSTNGKITFNIVAGEQVKLFVYYYNFNTAQNTYGSINIFTGLSEYVASWSYIDVTPPATPEWHDTPLVTYAADPGAATTKVVLQFDAPVTWPTNWDNLSADERVGILNDPDLAGHNIYRVSTATITTGIVEIGDPAEAEATIIYSGSNIEQFIHGQAVYSTGTAIFSAALYDSTTPEIGDVVVTQSGTIRYKNWSNFYSPDTNEKLYNGDFEISTHGYVPSGWTFSGNGLASAKYADNRIGYYCLLNNNTSSGTAEIYQYVNTRKSHKFKLDFSIENTTTGIGLVFIKKDNDIIFSYTLSGNGYYLNSLHFNSPINTGINVGVLCSGNTSLNIYDLSLYDVGSGSAMECSSATTNYMKNGSFENTLSGWSSLSISDITWDTSLFGYKTPTIFANSGCGLYQITTIPNAQAATLSAYLNVYNGSVNLYRLGGTPTIITNTSGLWQRHIQYTVTGYNTILITANENNTVFSLDGVQLEVGRRLTCFDDINFDGVTSRNPSFVKYSGVNVSGNSGTIRTWFTPSWKSTDYASPSDLKYIWCRGSGTELWTFEYNGYYQTIEFTTISGASFGQIGVPHTFNNRHEAVHLVCTWSGNNAEIWVNGVRGVVNESIYTNRNRYDIPSDLFFIGGIDGAGNNIADGSIEGLLIDTKKWTPDMIIADYNASQADITDELTIRNTRTRNGNLIVNSNFAIRDSLTDIYGWSIVTSGSASMAADYSYPKFSDVSLKITT